MLSRPICHRLTATGQMIGTPHYAAPEKITAKKDLGLEVDIYSMSVILYEALAGDPPYLVDTTIDIFRLHLTSSPKPLTEVFPSEPQLTPFDSVIQKAMAKKPEKRYSRAEAMRQALEGALAASEGTADATQAMPRISLPDHAASEEPAYDATVKMGRIQVDGTEKMATQPRPSEPTMLLQEEATPKPKEAFGLWGKILRLFGRSTRGLNVRW